MDCFKAGAGREIITPEIGARLYGYTLDVFAESVHDDLTVTAAAFEYKGIKAVLISAAVCLINNDLCDEIRNAVSEKTKIPFSNIIISAIHTHSGPCTAGNTGWGELDREYCDGIFIPKIISAVKTALKNLVPAELGIGTVKSEIGINRRQLNQDNSVSLGQNPWGCYDPALTVLSFRSLKGEPVANIVHYGAHCTASGKNTEITRDWAGVMIDALEKESGAVTAFFNGAEGDVGPRLANGLTVGNIDIAMEHGKKAAKDAVRAYKKISNYSAPGLECLTGDIKLPYAPVMPIEEAREKLATFKGERRVNLAGRTYEYLTAVVEAYQRGLPEETHFVFRQTIIKIGPAVFIPFPFEAFSEISLRLRQYSPWPHTLLIGCSNGNNGYLPSQDQLCRGGYEIEVFRTSGVLNLSEDTDYHIISENMKIMEDFKCTE